MYLGVGWLLWEARKAYLGMQSLSVQAARFSNTGDGRYDDQDFLVDQSAMIEEDTVTFLNIEPGTLTLTSP